MLRYFLVFAIALAMFLVGIGLRGIVRQQAQTNRWRQGIEMPPEGSTREVLPYLLTIAGMLPLGLAVNAAWYAGAFQGLPQRPQIDPGTAYYLLPSRNGWRKRLNAALISAGIWQLVGLLVWGHFFLSADGSWIPVGPEGGGPPGDLDRQRGMAVVCAILHGAVGLVPLVYAAYLWRIRGRITEPRVRATAGDRFLIGQTLPMHIVDYRDYGYEPEYAAIALRCQHGGREGFAQWIELTQGWRDVGSLIQAPTFQVPADRPCSSRHCVWEVVMVTKHKNGPLWRTVHPIRMEAERSR
jgi:hypothetical protein